MFLEWEKSSRKFQNNANKDVKQISLSHVLREWTSKYLIEISYLPHELLLTTRQKNKLRNAFENNFSTDISFLRLKYLN